MKKLQFWTSIAIILMSCCLVIFASDGNSSGSPDGKPANTNIVGSVNSVNH